MEEGDQHHATMGRVLLVLLRFTDPENDELPWGQDEESYWMPVDLYWWS